MVFISEKDRDVATATSLVYRRDPFSVVLGGFEIEHLPLAADRVFSLPFKTIKKNRWFTTQVYPDYSEPS